MSYRVGNTAEANIRVDLDTEYAAFDSLPPWAQDAIRRSPYAYSALAVKRQLYGYRMQGIPEDAVRDKYGPYLASPDPRLLRQQWGPDHPQLDPTFRTKPI